MLSIFSCVYWSSICLLWRNVCLDLLPIFFDWAVCFPNTELFELLIYFGDYPLLAVSFVIIFSHSEGCLLILFIVSFSVQKLLGFIKSHLFIFVFISIILDHHV